MIAHEVEALLCPDRSHLSTTLRFRVLSKQGEPFLLLPPRRQMSKAALDLYSAQTTKARLARSVLRVSLGLGVPFPAEGLTVPVDSEADFPRFLAELNGGTQPEFAVMLGNPRRPGRRLVILLFNDDHAPSCVVKAGVTPQSRALIEVETRFVSMLPAGTTGIPTVRATLQTANVQAMALEYVDGESPRVPDDDEGLTQLMIDWLHRDRTLELSEIPAWRRLCDEAGEDFEPLLAHPPVAEASVHPTLYHGDFAPWNLRLHEGKWTALDWERAEWTGVPGWDWFQFLTHPAILVERSDTATVWGRLDALLRSPGFGKYADRSGIRGIEHHLLRAYLLYCVTVIKPIGVERFDALLRHALKVPISAN